MLNDKLPHGFDSLNSRIAAQLRTDYNEWREAIEEQDPYLKEIHEAWINEVLSKVLEYDNVVLRREGIPENLEFQLPEYGIVLKPDMILTEPAKSGSVLMLISVFDPDLDLTAAIQTNGYVASAKDRMISMLKTNECSVGLITNGEMWMLVR